MIIRLHLLTACLTLLAYLPMHAQTTTLPLYPSGKVPNWKEAGEKEVRNSGDIAVISKVQVPDIAVYLPAKRNATGQAVLVCPGGGYAVLAYDWEGSDIAKWLNSKGIAAIVLKYRLPNAKSNITPHLTPLMDAKRGMRHIRAHAAEWNINPGKVGVMGFSAGGHLASTLGTQFDAGDASAQDSIERFSSRPDFMVLVYPVISMNSKYTHSGSKGNLLGANPDTALVQRYSGELNVTTATPPTFLIHATDDTAVPVENSLLFYGALKDKNVPAEMHIYPYGGHGFGLAIGKGYLQTWNERLADWLAAMPAKK